MRDIGWRRTAVASALICATGGALLAHATDNFRAFTSEMARRNAVRQSPTPVPVVALEDQDGRPFDLSAYRGRPVVVDFVYTQCRTTCPMLSAGFQRLARAQVRDTSMRTPLLSISFDSTDSPAVLRAYADRYAADGRLWRFARVRDATRLPSLLDAFGIVVIPDGKGDFQHNAAVHVVDSRGRLARILDVAASPEVVAGAVAASGSIR